MTEFFIKKRVTSLMIVLVIMLAGTVAYNALELAFYPNVDFPVAAVSTTYTGAGPEEMEDLVTKPLEQVLATMTGVKTITSRSATGSSIVAIQFVDGTNIDSAVNDMRDKVDRIKPLLPNDANDPMILKMDLTSTTIEVGVTSDKYDINTLYNLCDDNISSEFERIEGVASVALTGGQDDLIKVTVDQDKLNSYGISINAISAAMKAENANTPTGTLDEGNLELQLRTEGEFKDVEDIKNLYITTKAGNSILLKDVAKVEKTKEDKEGVTYVNGTEGLSYMLTKSTDGNIVAVTDRIIQAIENINKRYPDIEFQVMTTTSDYIKTSVKNIVETAFQSALVAVLVLLFFLRDWKTSLIIGVSIPTSMFATFALMYVSGMSLNMISMGGVVIAIGMLVDNSVVVLENIFQHAQKGEKPFEAAANGTKEVTMAIIASTLTSIAVFGPMLFLKDTMGQLLSNIALTVVYALSASLIVSLTFVPMASCMVMKQNETNKRKRTRKGVFGTISYVIGKFLAGMDNLYSKILHAAIGHKLITIIIALLVFIGSLGISRFVGQDLMSRGDEGVVKITAELPSGSKLEATEAMLNTLLDRIGEVPEQKSMVASASGTSSSVSTSSGLSAGSTASITYNLVDKEERDRSSDDVKKDIEGKLKGIAGAEITVSTSSSAMGSVGGSGFTVRVKGKEIDELKRVYNELAEKLTADGATNVESNLDDSIPQGSIVIDRAKAAKYGISTATVANAVSAANNGVKATTFKENGTEIDVKIKYDEEKINYVTDLNNITVTTPAGAVIPITEIADIEMSLAATSIYRNNQSRYVQITGEYEGLDAASQKEKITKIFDSYDWPDGYNYEFAGVTEMMGDTFTNLIIVLLVAIILVYMIMASQFESFIYPFILMFSMPIAITGGIFGLFVTRMNITSSVLMGFILLVGMVVNNGIVLIDYANQMRERYNIWVDEAMYIAGPSRLRPILMTTLTTIVGMIPMAFAMGSGMESMQPMGIAIIGGLTASTLLTLVFIPVLYCMVASILRRIKYFMFGKPIAEVKAEREAQENQENSKADNVKEEE